MSIWMGSPDGPYQLDATSIWTSFPRMTVQYKSVLICIGATTWPQESDRIPRMTTWVWFNVDISGIPRMTIGSKSMWNGIPVCPSSMVLSWYEWAYPNDHTVWFNGELGGFPKWPSNHIYRFEHVLDPRNDRMSLNLILIWMGSPPDEHTVWINVDISGAPKWP